MKYLLLILFVFILQSCGNEKANRAEDVQENNSVANHFDFELIGDVTDKMKNVTSIRINKKDGSGNYQILDGFEALVQENEQVIVEDLNFDGHSDIRLLQYLPETASIPFFYWLYNPKTAKFERNTALEVVLSPSLDFEKEYILSQWTKTDKIQGTDYYKFAGNQLKLVKQETQEFTDSVNYIFTIKEAFGDSLKTVEQKTLKRKGVIQKVITNEFENAEEVVD